jgi:hypothetical protein
MTDHLSAMRDPVGVTFIKGDQVKRGIRKEFASYFRTYSNPSQFKICLEKHHPRSIAKEPLPYFALTLDHPDPPAQYAYEGHW